MPLTVDFLPIANGAGANVETQAQWVADIAGSLANGFVSGIASSKQFNKVWRQSSMMAAAIATFIANTNNANVLDDGNLPNLVAALTSAINTAAASIVPTHTVYTSNSGTFTTPVGARILHIRMVGAGGGGAGAGSGGNGPGGVGTDTTFGTLIGNGGGGGGVTDFSAGSGASGGTLNIGGVRGGCPGNSSEFGGGLMLGGAGASSQFAGTTFGGQTVGKNGVAGSGGAGSGAYVGNPGFGGGSGGYVEHWIANPLASYSYSVGSGGASGVGGGGVGGAGLIIVEAS